MTVVFGSMIGASFFISYVVVARVLALSHKKSWYDRIDDRKIHTGDVPRLGGVGFVSAFICACFAIIFVVPRLPGHSVPGAAIRLSFLFPLAAMALIFAAGVFDDFKPMAPRYKLLIQIIAAALVVVPGHTFHSVIFSNLGMLGELNWLRYPLTAVWIVGLTNAVNLIDGVDGLAGGVSTLAAVFFAVIFSIISGSDAMALVCLCLGASLAGFLVFNMPFPRAKIFMGDGGAQFLGFVLALLPLIKLDEEPIRFPLLYAAALLAIPIFDTFASIWRRIRDRRRIDDPDKLHIHHKLMNLGFNARGVDGALYALQIMLGVLVCQSLRFKDIRSVIFLAAAYATAAGFFIAIHFVNLHVVHKREKARRP
ncbi:MAG: undecaprenyl/decaprenyl-phosphate alpha-N-acetylglucosaminyl 1-phosphate transferase [Treponema sp.]|jgi:UDP-GlcNAc:undecaprenyl-phosphate GlcNAc-1-phosphate transferase|nr:undecaprenyl/decaprenyl-phosphate alpha-N-acetylglucosaminyl 1-phosphate transferase [Treponema sp.]